MNKLHHFAWSGDPDRYCSCGHPILECGFWQGVRARWEAEVRMGSEAPGLGHDPVAEYVALQHRFERYLPPTRPLWVAQAWRRSSRDFVRYTRMTAALYRAVAAESGKDVVVDSSKNRLRALALVWAADVDLTLLHLIRDGRGVVWSHTKPKDRRRNPPEGIPQDFAPTPAWRVSVDWSVKNLEAAWVAAQAPHGRSVRIHYEDLVADPAPTLARVGAATGLELEAIARRVQEGKPFRAEHLPEGNRIRMAGEIVVREDESWREAIRKRDLRVFELLGGWVNRRFGYGGGEG